MIHIMYGLPASGKTTLAMELFEKYKYGEVLETISEVQKSLEEYYKSEVAKEFFQNGAQIDLENFKQRIVK